MSQDPDDRIQALASAGEYAAAGKLALASGDALRAAQLFAEVWQWDDAAAAAKGAGRHDLAYRYAVSSNDAARIEAALGPLYEHEEQARASAEYATERGRHDDAARLLESIGEVEAAAQAFIAAAELFDAARLLESMGEYRQAGKLYEARLRDEPNDARAALRLARILASFGRYKPAIAALQTAERDDESAPSALRMMVACFAALNMDEAAGRCLERLIARAPQTPASVQDFLEATYGDAGGIAALHRQGQGGQLLAGRYRTLDELGAGATGRVLRAHDSFYDRDVAVKILTVGGGARGRDAYARFAREARIATALDHPNIVRVLEFNADGPFLVMEFMRGGTLEQRLQDAGGRLPLEAVAHVLRSLTGALEAVHRRGITHRDVKPANVFFGATGEVKLGDFGASHLADLSATLTSAMVGTLAYMAPEQVTGGGHPSAATDLYALGVVAFQLLTGSLPFKGPDYVAQHLNETPPRVSELAPELGTLYDGLVSALLRKDAGERTADAGTLRDQIDGLPWVDPETKALAVAAPQAQRAAGANHPDSAQSAGEHEPQRVGPGARYAPLDEGAAAAFPWVRGLAPEECPQLLHDTLLERTVCRVQVDPAQAAQLVALAGADHPHLQAVYDLDPDAGVALLECPRGTPLSMLGELKGQPGLSESDQARARAQVESALAALHGRGLPHGAVDSDHVLVGPGRALLLLPGAAGAGALAQSGQHADRRQDQDALARLFEARK